MSTNLRLEADEHVVVQHRTEEATGLSSLIDKLSALEKVPSLVQLHEWLGEASIDADELQPIRRFKEATYARHRLMKNEHAELLMLCWRPGQRTPIHDHNGSLGAVLVCEGVLWETLFELNDERELYYRSACEWRAGEVTGADVPDIHQLGNPEVSGQDLVTLHIYAPPLGVLNTYRIGSAEVGHYSPDEFIHGAGI